MLLRVDSARPSLAYGEITSDAGLHLMETPTEHWVETLTGLGATGVELVLVAAERPVEAHPLVPVVQVGRSDGTPAGWQADFDLLLSGDVEAWSGDVLDLILRAASREHAPALAAARGSDFQVTRGRLGVSM
jgi:hypothetical protein